MVSPVTALSAGVKTGSGILACIPEAGHLPLRAYQTLAQNSLNNHGK
jgi:hypothetical protein